MHWVGALKSEMCEKLRTIYLKFWVPHLVWVFCFKYSAWEEILGFNWQFPGLSLTNGIARKSICHYKLLMGVLKRYIEFIEMCFIYVYLVNLQGNCIKCIEDKPTKAKGHLYLLFYILLLYLMSSIIIHTIIGRSTNKRTRILPAHSAPIWVTTSKIDNNLHLNMEHILQLTHFGEAIPCLEQRSSFSLKR